MKCSLSHPPNSCIGKVCLFFFDSVALNFWLLSIDWSNRTPTHPFEWQSIKWKSITLIRYQSSQWIRKFKWFLSLKTTTRLDRPNRFKSNVCKVFICQVKQLTERKTAVLVNGHWKVCSICLNFVATTAGEKAYELVPTPSNYLWICGWL